MQTPPKKAWNDLELHIISSNNVNGGGVVAYPEQTIKMHLQYTNASNHKVYTHHQPTNGGTRNSIQNVFDTALPAYVS